MCVSARAILFFAVSRVELVVAPGFREPSFDSGDKRGICTSETSVAVFHGKTRQNHRQVLRLRHLAVQGPEPGIVHSVEGTHKLANGIHGSNVALPKPRKRPGKQRAIASSFHIAKTKGQVNRNALGRLIDPQGAVNAPLLALGLGNHESDSQVCLGRRGWCWWQAGGRCSYDFRFFRNSPCLIYCLPLNSILASGFSFVSSCSSFSYRCFERLHFISRSVTLSNSTANFSNRLTYKALVNKHI